ncbi:protein trichome birefringence-like 4 [Argentina anserina]|uniref:protein trichome birefringence-like 4 n=1 Tax=Argentina anserina TaxID=57926 RepID=UPI002176788B|nr:protein trichome birefringence-like 4 [Potentilla anserina]
MVDWGHKSTTEYLLPTTLGESKASPRPSVLAHITTSTDYSSMSSSPHSTRAETSKASMFSIFFSKRNFKVCTYAFIVSFIACTILLVFNPSLPSVPFGFKNLLHTSPQTQDSHWKSNSLPRFDENGSLKGNVGVDQKGFEIGLDQSSGKNGGTKENAETERDSHTGTPQPSNATKENLETERDHHIGIPQPSNTTKENVEIARDDHIGTSQLSNATTFSTFKDSSHTGTEVSDKVEGSEKRNETKNALSFDSSSNGENDMNKKGKQTGMKLNNECDLYDGRWMRDDSYPLYAAGSCPYIDEPFNCFLNGRPDNGYEKYRWQPKHCNIPRLNGKKMLRLLTGKRLVFVGDSLNRNMWESLLCVLRNSVEEKNKVYEVSGREEFRTEASYSFIFQDYNCSVEFFQSQFLVQEWEGKHKNGSKKETLRIDLMESAADNYKDADVLIFNTAHWWTHEKTSNGLGYYQEGDHVYDELNGEEAYRRALSTWGTWVDTNIDPKKTAVFFRGYSPSHFRGGAWNSGGQCHGETKPTTETEYGGEYPSNMKILDSVMEKMKIPIHYLNITAMTDFRKDAHPSVYRMPNLTAEERKANSIQDCSHWCLPGVPETWNELIYAQLLRRNKQQRKKKQHKQKRQQ